MQMMDIFYISLMFLLVAFLCYKSRKNIESGEYDGEVSISEGVSPGA